VISIEEARERILARIERLPTQAVPVVDAFRRTLAESVVAHDAIPPFDNSAMDGYAVIAADTAGASPDAPVTLTETGSVAAGYVPGHAVGSGEAIRIMTGAPMPEGADAVVMIEDTTTDGGKVTIAREARAKDHVRFAGEDIPPGATAVEAGTMMKPAHIGLAAALGYAELTVSVRPKVAIISTGDELVEPGTPLAPGQIRNSNAFSIAAQVLEAGGEPIRLGIAKDTEDDVRAKLAEGLAAADAVITTGGVSVGDYDVVKAVLESMGEMVFWTVAMKPGKPLAFGILSGKPVFGVPGNPATSVVSFETFIRPALLKMQGRTNLLRPVAHAVLDVALKKKPGRAHLVRAVVRHEADGLHASPAGPQGSAVLSTMTRADALLVLAREAEGYEAGDKVPAILIDWEGP
jgi:molybdopterin molybdotransferase